METRSFGQIADNCGNCMFPQVFQTVKLGDLSVFYAVLEKSNRVRITKSLGQGLRVQYFEKFVGKNLMIK